MAVITISRQFGSGGREIAARVCELLGYRYFDKELIAQVAAEVGLSENEAVDFSEEHYKGKSLIEQLFRPGPHTVAEIPSWKHDAATGAEILSVQELDQARFVSLIRKVIVAAYNRGNVVIGGRGGQVVLADLPGVLHVRLEAPLAVRVLRVQEQEGLDLEAAQKWVNERDRAVAKYLGGVFDIRGEDSQWYHLIINTSKWPLETTAQIIVEAVGRL